MQLEEKLSFSDRYADLTVRAIAKTKKLGKLKIAITVTTIISLAIAHV
ncbi:MAG: hypothetical protein SAJ37_12660 [Oscillatoria sp. PMC 1068.18]|nr:hypothetical protein [Oscillatoria sp. PMC 1076.18]MEC4989595.1 hypothetical protein [Oscillatoria sp. PMC 1068.18]